jgi:hypothetical protein
MQEPATKYPISLVVEGPINQAPPACPLPMAYATGALSYLRGLDFKRLLPRGCVGRAERGDSAYSPNAQRRTSARHNHRQA